MEITILFKSSCVDANQCFIDFSRYEHNAQDDVCFRYFLLQFEENLQTEHIYVPVEFNNSPGDRSTTTSICFLNFF